MRKVTSEIQIVLHFQKFTVEEIIPFAGSIKTKSSTDPQVVIDPLIITRFGVEIKDLAGTVELRETDKSSDLTTLEGKQATKVMLTLEEIAGLVQKQANTIANGDKAVATIIVQRIGFEIRKTPSLAGRFFEVFKTLIGMAFIRIKADNKYSLYHWRWSSDEITWTRLPDTRVASVVITGLPSKKEAYFQSAVTLKTKGAPKLSAFPVEPQWGDSISALIP